MKFDDKEFDENPIKISCIWFDSNIFWMELGRKKTDWSLYSQVMQASGKVGKESELDSIAPKSVLKYLSCCVESDMKKNHTHLGAGS